MKNSTLPNTKTRRNHNLFCCSTLVFLLSMGFFSPKTSAQGTLVPACNLIGPLEACAVSDNNDTSNDIIINVDVARSGSPNLFNATTNLNFTYSFSSNSSGAFIRSFGPVIYNAGTNRTTQTLVVCPGTGTPEFNLQLDVVNTSSSPNTICECSKSVSVSRVAATTSHTPIICAGGTSTLTVVGQFSDIGIYSYTLLPSGPTNSDGIFTGLTGSVGGTTYTVSVMSAEECVTAVSETITAPAANEIVLNCPPETTAQSCQTQDAINTAFNTWLNSFSFSGGTNSVLTRSPLNPNPPARCGGSIPVTWTVTDDCGQSQSCTRTFSVSAPFAITLNCPANITTAACQSQTAVNNAFTAWLATASANGGCNGALTNDNTGAPPACGGSRTVTFTYTSSCAPLTTTCQATFTVVSAQPVVLNCPANQSVSSSLSQAAIDAAYTTWLQSASASGGCGGNLTNNSTGSPTACGTSKTVTFSYSNSCGQPTTCQSTFSINACTNSSHIFPTQTTCCNYVTGTATGLYNVCTKLNGRTVNNAIPGVFFYYAGIVAPSSSFTINVKQSNDGDLNKLFTIQNAQQIRLTNSSCGNVSFSGSMLNGDTEARYVVTGATPGATYIVSLKYEVKSIIGAVYTGADNKSTYTFGSYVNNVLQSASVGTIDALGGCTDNTPLPGSCSLPSGKQSSSSIAVTVYPNPFSDNFKLDVKSVSEEDIHIKVYDMLGKLIDSRSVQMSDIDAFELGDNYPAGIYNIMITQGTEVKTQRVIKR